MYVRVACRVPSMSVCVPVPASACVCVVCTCLVQLPHLPRITFLGLSPHPWTLRPPAHTSHNHMYTIICVVTLPPSLLCCLISVPGSMLLPPCCSSMLCLVVPPPVALFASPLPCLLSVSLSLCYMSSAHFRCYCCCCCCCCSCLVCTSPPCSSSSCVSVHELPPLSPKRHDGCGVTCSHTHWNMSCHSSSSNTCVMGVCGCTHCSPCP